MSTLASPPNSHSGSPLVQATDRASFEHVINERIEEARRALWWSELTRSVLRILIGGMSALLLWLVLDHWVYSPSIGVRVLCFAGSIGAGVWYFVRHTWPLMTKQVTREYAAWALEKDQPDYRQQLTSYVTLKPEASKGVRARVVQVIGSRAASLLKTYDVLPSEATGTFRWWIAAAALFAVLAAYAVASPKSSVESAKRLIAPLASIDPAKRVQIRNVSPGNTRTLAGRQVSVSAEVLGLFSDEIVTCLVTSETSEKQIELVFDENADAYVGNIDVDHSSTGSLQYSIEAGDASSGPYRIWIENVPVVAVESLRYEPPAYTGAQARTTTSPAINAIDATKVLIRARTNRPVARAELQLNCKQVGDDYRSTGGIVKMQIADDGVSLSASMTMRSAVGRPNAVEPENYRIRVWDHSDQANPDPIIYPIKIVPDLPPDVTIVVPRKSPKEVPVNGQQTIEVHAMDPDYELAQVQLKVTRGLDTLAEPIIWKRETNGKGNQVAVFRFRPFIHRLGPGDKVKVTATAIDNRNIPNDPRIKPNSVTTDPVELRIVETESNLPEDPTDNDGLSTPDKQPPTDVKPSESGEGGSASGSGTSGGESESEQSSQNGQSGQGQSGGESGEEQEPNENSVSNDGSADGESGDQENSSNDPKQSSGGSDSSSSSGENSQQNGKPNQDGNQNAADGSDENSPNQNQQTSDSSDASNSDGQGTKAQPENNNTSTDATSDQTDQGNSETTGNTDPGNNQQNQSSSGNSSGGDDTGEMGSEEAFSENSASNNPNQSGSESSDHSSDDSQKSAPEHDGEAFERIKDFLERKQNQPQGSGASDQQQSKDQSGQSETESSETGSSDESQSGDSAEQSPENQGSGKEGSEQQAKPDQQSGSNHKDKGASGENQSGESGSEASPEQSGETGQEGDTSDQSGEPNQAPSKGEGDSDAMNPSDQTDGSSDDQEPSQGDPSGNSPESDSPSSSDQQSSSDQNNTADASNQPSANQPSASEASPNGKASNGNDSGSSPFSETDDAEPPPPPDLDYAKQATDMVLDYLDENRDKIDDDLLEDLNWSADDLERFRKRWEKVRDIDQAGKDANQSQQFEDALKSLGLQPGHSTQNATNRPNDSLRNLKDSGNRRQVPAPLRDAFEAFRRR
ncbi:hypothetical protein LOC67_08635 [Stieleria sp. JC731]|uniref:hypothetical protein n=1 Tax=Pirellulaceae TaxID=2691357 RepID=UPI001E55444B|nr:hypothetical protein [Stieleria sp. JC731]MCC9600626.1 hypothetical protein [Stieleria sp. JC731]